MDPDLNRLEGEFEQKLDRWLSKQGIFFQLKHAKSAGSIFPKICALLFRLLIIFIIGMLIFWFYLKNRPSSDGFKNLVENNLKVGTNASSAEIKSIERYKGGLLEAKMKISNFQLGSSKATFFEDYYVQEEERDLKGNKTLKEVKKQLTVHTAIIFPLGIGDGLLNGWSGKKITLGSLHCHLKTGGDTDEEAMTAYSSLFKDYKDLVVDSINIETATISWGYGISKGSIKGAEIEALRNGDKWTFSIRGGVFSHGWLKNTDINSMEIECHKNGLIKITEADLGVGEKGSLSFSASIQMKAKPVVTGEYEFKAVEVLDLVGEEYAQYLGGRIKGTGTLKGTLNSVSGVAAKTSITLEAPSREKLRAIERAQRKSRNIDKESDLELASLEQKKLEESDIVIRGNFPLLKTMKSLNPVFSYLQIQLNIGELEVEQTGGDTIISNINVRSSDFLIIKGALKYVWGKAKKETTKVDADGGLNEILTDDKKKEEKEEDFDTSNQQLVKLISGKLDMGFIPQVFARNPEILEVYPEDPDTIRVWLPVEMEGELQEASAKIANKLRGIVQKVKEKKQVEAK